MLIPISTVFASNKDAYLARLKAFRAEPSRLSDWIIGVAHAAELAVANAVRLSVDIEALDQTVRDELSHYRKQSEISPAIPRSDAVILRILDTLASEPVLTSDTVVFNSEAAPAAISCGILVLGFFPPLWSPWNPLLAWSGQWMGEASAIAFVVLASTTITCFSALVIVVKSAHHSEVHRVHH